MRWARILGGVAGGLLAGIALWALAAILLAIFGSTPGLAIGTAPFVALIVLLGLLWWRRPLIDVVWKAAFGAAFLLLVAWAITNLIEIPSAVMFVNLLT
ncbi:hypothetical protein MFM001_24500 [Mycobacterium sp. MFM001]|nr:hypothetical protein MFM001_24500 [Mycobacterium sp. MFM001]